MINEPINTPRVKIYQLKYRVGLVRTETEISGFLRELPELRHSHYILKILYSLKCLATNKISRGYKNKV